MNRTLNIPPPKQPIERHLHLLKCYVVKIYSRLDIPLLLGLLALTGFGLIILLSASDQNIGIFKRQLLHTLLALLALLVFTQISAQTYLKWAPILFTLVLLLLVLVLILGAIGKGAQRWLAVGPIRFEPSELMKITLPLTLACYFNRHSPPPNRSTLIVSCLLIFAPALLVAKEPDLGTAIIIVASGSFVLLLAGLSQRLILSISCSLISLIPISWHWLHSYQKERVLNFLHPERSPLGSGYHIIQSKIAIGSGGLLGKGWLQGSQSHLQFLPEHATDFIFALCGEEFGLLGSLLLISLAAFITYRGLYLSYQAKTTFNQLTTASLSLTFFFSVFVNIGMVTGLLPVVGLPLPFISYGGTSMITMMASFGIIMSTGRSHQY